MVSRVPFGALLFCALKSATSDLNRSAFSGEYAIVSSTGWVGAACLGLTEDDTSGEKTSQPPQHSASSANTPTISPTMICVEAGVCLRDDLLEYLITASYEWALTRLAV